MFTRTITDVWEGLTAAGIPETIAGEIIIRLSDRLDTPTPPNEPKVTPTQQRVWRLVAETHMTQTEMAAHLGVAVPTIKSHLQDLYAKLGVHSRREAADAWKTR